MDVRAGSVTHQQKNTIISHTEFFQIWKESMAVTSPAHRVMDPFDRRTAGHAALGLSFRARVCMSLDSTAIFC